MSEWWQVFDLPELQNVWGILLLAFVIVLVMLAAGVGIAYAWHKWRG